MARSHKLREEIVGRRFGILTAVEYLGLNEKQRRSMYRCICDCGKERKVRSDSLLRGAANSCGCANLNRRRGSSNVKYKGYGNISGRFLANIKHGAIRRKMEFSITPEYMWDLFLKQDKKCVYSGMELSLPSTTMEERTASLDRIDSSKGYIEGNVQWIHKDINVMKQDYSQNHFFMLIGKIFKHSLKNIDS